MHIRRFDGGVITVDYYQEGAVASRVRRIEGPEVPPLTYEYDASGRVIAVGCGETCRVEYVYDDKGRLIEIRQRSTGGQR